jgi:serine/threonine-protein kinase
VQERHRIDLRAPHERERFRVDEALEIMIPVMGALAAAHHVGIVHRDVKPDNIVLTRSPSGEILPKLIDFGVARVHSPQGSLKATQVGTLLGTLSYMSPEQVRAQHPLDGRTDVWAVGVVLYELLSAYVPTRGLQQAVIPKIVMEPPRIEAR